MKILSMIEIYSQYVIQSLIFHFIIASQNCICILNIIIEFIIAYSKSNSNQSIFREYICSTI